MKWDSPYRKWALPAGKKKNQYSLMKRRLIGIEQMKPSFHTKKRLKEGGASANVILSSKIHVSTVGRTEDKNNWSSLELYWASFINRQSAAACPCKKPWTAKWKTDKYQTLDLFGDSYSKVITQSNSWEQDIQERSSTEKRDRQMIWKKRKDWKKIFEDASVKTAIKIQKNEQMSSRSPF